MRIAKKLKMTAEINLVPSVLEHGRYHLAQYGHLVAQAIREDNDDWLASLLASSYWRIRGRPIEAIDCLRKATYFSPKVRVNSH